MALPGDYKFTNKKHHELGIMSAILGCISCLFLILTVLVTFINEKPVSASYGLTCFLGLIMAITGETFGIIIKKKKDIYGLFPLIGIITNGVSLAICLLFVIAGSI